MLIRKTASTSEEASVLKPVKASKIRCFWFNCSDCTPVSKS
ncbi:uncharacterized protein G2W53_041464 [Senna tora]|uniref:Uncharacterized protein n=1 Tax=Senna tora TaxID=362788 RepID=A0A834VXZ8_9FABA|nr:uncharacterized protein G2W53_041464 [Senna tora]